MCTASSEHGRERETAEPAQRSPPCSPLPTLTHVPGCAGSCCSSAPGTGQSRGLRGGLGLSPPRPWGFPWARALAAPQHAAAQLDTTSGAIPVWLLAQGSFCPKRNTSASEEMPRTSHHLALSKAA